VLYPVELRMQRGRYPIREMNTNHDNHDKPLTGFEPAIKLLQSHAFDLLATRAEGGEREKYQQKPLTIHRETNTALNEQSLLAHRKE
jgi:hypothetical protein